MSALVPAAGHTEVDVFGFRIPVDLSDFIQRSMYLATFEPEEVALFERLLRPGMTFVDIGANVGYFTMLAARRVGPSGRVIAVEPSPYAAGRLRSAVVANRIECVVVVQSGLSSREGTMPLFVPPARLGNHTPTMTTGHPESERVDVPVTTLDRLLDAHGVDVVDVLKVDVEGHEPQVFAGGVASLSAGRVKEVVCEFNVEWLEQAGSSPKALRAQFEGFGFEEAGDLHATGACVNRHFHWTGHQGRGAAVSRDLADPRS